MKHCFEVLGLDETAAREQILAAYTRKKALYSGNVFDEDPQYAKKKLKELDQAVREAWLLAEPAEDDASAKEQEESLQKLLSEDELHMQELYHEHLTTRANRMAGVPHKKRSSEQKKADSAYKGSVLLFWGGIAAVVILIGLIL